MVIGLGEDQSELSFRNELCESKFLKEIHVVVPRLPGQEAEDMEERSQENPKMCLYIKAKSRPASS
jgi:hypothetical protein